MTDFEFNTPITLENERVRLEPLENTHLDQLLPIAIKYPDLLKYSPSNFGTKEYLREYINAALQNKAHQLRYPLVIFDREKDAYAGSTSIGNVSNSDHRFEIGWTWIGKDFQGTGLNHNCKYLLLEFGFETLGFQRIEFKTDSRNLQSRKALEKIGARLEGELRSHSVMYDGFRRDTVYYSILKQEWPDIKSRVFDK